MVDGFGRGTVWLHPQRLALDIAGVKFGKPVSADRADMTGPMGQGFPWAHGLAAMADGYGIHSAAPLRSFLTRSRAS